MEIVYRLSQFWQNVTAGPLTPEAAAEVAAILSDREMMLFRQMLPTDQRHAYRVFRLLEESDQTNGDLLAAALLHDVGKVRVDLSTWDRSVAVLGEAFVPQKADEWGSGEAEGWKRPFVVRKNHPAWGARLAEEAGSRPAVVDLIRRHQDKPTSDSRPNSDLLAMLQWADDQS
jgi:hypothetical protein